VAPLKIYLTPSFPHTYYPFLPISSLFAPYIFLKNHSLTDVIHKFAILKNKKTAKYPSEIAPLLPSLSFSVALINREVL
jgi:hypothetical protein